MHHHDLLGVKGLLGCCSFDFVKKLENFAENFFFNEGSLSVWLDSGGGPSVELTGWECSSVGEGRAIVGGVWLVVGGACSESFFCLSSDNLCPWVTNL